MSHEKQYGKIFEEFLAFYKLHPDAKNSLYYEHFPDVKQDTIRKYKQRAKKQESQIKEARVPSKSRSSLDQDDNNSSTKQKKKKKKKKKSFIDDPDELLFSVAIRELNKPNPDPRWANILINCKKENISTKKGVLEQFKQLPTQTLVNLLSKNLLEDAD